jgi:non-haem Fe2+, alpha-ketoglutarate-dependent halogenase
MLSRNDVESYRRAGYLPGRRLLSPAEAERFRKNCLRTCAKPIELSDQNPYSLKRHASNRVKPYLLFPWAAELVRYPSVLDLVEAVIGPDILVFHTTAWLKAPHSENYVPWHQDATYFGLAPFEHVTAWVALTPSRPESGCVRVITGFHHKGQLAHVDDHGDPLTILSRGQTLAENIREDAVGNQRVMQRDIARLEHKVHRIAPSRTGAATGASASATCHAAIPERIRSRQAFSSQLI